MSTTTASCMIFCASGLPRRYLRVGQEAVFLGVGLLALLLPLAFEDRWPKFSYESSGKS